MPITKIAETATEPIFSQGKAGSKTEIAHSRKERKYSQIVSKNSLIF
jgi:hypothetical protein